MTYNCRVNKCAPATVFLEQSQDKGYSSGAKEDENELIFELLENELPQGSRWLVRNSCKKRNVVSHLVRVSLSTGWEKAQHTILAMLLPQLHHLRI